MIRVEPFNDSQLLNREAEGGRVLEIYSQLMPYKQLDDEYDVQQLIKQLSNTYTSVARDSSGSIVAVSSHSLPEKSDVLFLSGLAVEQCSQGRGTGRQMIDYIAMVALYEGKSAIELNAIESATGFYERLGAAVVGATTNRFRIDLE